MGEWSWVIVGYAAMVGSLVLYVWVMRSRLERARRRLRDSG